MFSGAYLLSVYLLWRRVCLNLLRIFSWVVCFLTRDSRVLYVVWIQALYQICDLILFSPMLLLVFSISHQCFSKSRNS